MTYTVAAVLGLAGAVLIDLVVLRTRLVLRRVFWATYSVIFAFQLLFNGILTGRGVVRYNPDAIVGLRVAGAPAEDVPFGFALVLMSLSLWIWWEGIVGSGSTRGRAIPPERRRSP